MNQKLSNCLATLETFGKEESGTFRHFAPVPRMVLLLGYLICMVSFGRYEWSGTFILAVVPYIFAGFSRISVWFLFTRSALALPFVLCAGIGNFFFDSPVGGAISLFVLTAKTFGTVGGVLLLTLTTSMSRITGALAALKVPCLLILQIQLLFRYLILAVEEAVHITNAYKMRNSKCRLIPIRDWGMLAGQLFVRTVRRGNAIYSAMQCRLFSARTPIPEAERSRKRDWIAVFLLFAGFAVVRFCVSDFSVHFPQFPGWFLDS